MCQPKYELTKTSWAIRKKKSSFWATSLRSASSVLKTVLRYKHNMFLVWLRACSPGKSPNISASMAKHFTPPLAPFQLAASVLQRLLTPGLLAPTRYLELSLTPRQLLDALIKGFSMLTLACPYKGRAIPFAFITYSEATLSQEATSRNLKIDNYFSKLKGYGGLTTNIR